MYQREKTYQVKCKCGNVREVHTHGNLLESDKVCHKCGTVITESNIKEVKQDLLLE